MRNFDTEKTYDVMMNRFKWGGLSKPGLYIDETVARMCYTHRREMAELALHLIAKDEKTKALKVLEKVEKEIPYYNIPLNYMSGASDLAHAHALLGQKAKARQIYEQLWKISLQYVSYYLTLSPRLFNISEGSCKMHFQIMMNLISDNEHTDMEWVNKHEPQLKKLFTSFEKRGGKLM